MAPSSLSLATGKGKGKALTVPAVEQLERSLQGSSDLNPISDLLDYLGQQQQPAEIHAAVYALHRVFGSLIRQGRLHGKLKRALSEDIDALKAVREWLRGQYNAYIGRLIELLPSSEGITALTILLDLLRTESEQMTAFSKSHVFADDLWTKIVAGLVQLPLQPEVRTEFVLRYLTHFDDVRYHLLKELGKMSLDGKRAEQALILLESIEHMPAYEAAIARFWCGAPARRSQTPLLMRARKKRKVDDGSTGIFDSSSESDAEPGAQVRPVKQPSLLSLKAHRKVFGQAWSAVLPLIRSEEALKRVLVILHAQVLPHLNKPTYLLDWLSDCCDRGGTTALLALNGLYTLMTKHNLEYPAFYRQLYALLDDQVLHMRYRARFFRMLDVFLSSTHLPSTLVASFAKRLSRLALSAPPAAILSVIPFVYNLLKLHPSCMVMIHREDAASDSYDPACPDPLTTGAIDSSLWEMATLQDHYLHSVAALARVFNETFTKPQYDMNDFVDHTWNTLFEAEASRVMKKAPALDLPSARAAKGVSFFRKSDGTEAWSDVVTELWSF